MTSKHQVSAFAVLLLVTQLAWAQSPPRGEAGQEEELKQARIERSKKALAAIEEIVKESQSLKLPENRFRIQIAVADLLWQRDEKRARTLFAAATASLGEITAFVETGDPEYDELANLPAQMRQEMLQIVAKHDARLALDFLRNSRPAAPPPGYSQINLEVQLELRLASEVATKDAKEALRIAEESLKEGIDYQAINLLYKVYSPDKAVAEKLLASILSRLRAEPLTKNPASWYVALTLLRTWSENNRAPQGLQRTTVDIQLANLNEQAARELSAGIIGAVLNNGLGGSPQLRPFSGQDSGSLQQLKSLMPDMERLSPNQVGVLRKKIAEFDKIDELQQGPWAKYQELIRSGTPEALIEASKAAPIGIADQLTQQAASKAFNQGDTDGARQIIAGIADPRQRNQMTRNIDSQLASRAGEHGSTAEARALLSRIPSIAERVRLLMRWATTAAEKGDRSSAIQLLGEARGLIGERSANYEHMSAQLEIARAYEQIDLGKSAAIVETAVDQLNELAVAALILDGFDLQHYFREGEFVMGSGNSMSSMAQEIAGELRSLALKDFDLARFTAARFQRAEMRAIALLQIVDGVLTEGGTEEAEEH